MSKKKRLWQAFSLVELMVLVALIGVLASVAVPRYRTFVARSRMSEAIHNLDVINKLQKAYNLHHQMIGNDDDVWYNQPLIGRKDTSSGGCDETQGANVKNKLGFRVEDCTKLRYFYTAGGAGQDSAKNGSGGSAVGYRIYPACDDGDDVWTIYRYAAGVSGPKLEHTTDIIEACK